MGKAPKPDKKIGEAALISAELGMEFLDFMKDQAQVTNGWADQDRARYQNTFQPLEDQYILDAQKAGNPEQRALEASARSDEAVADVRQQFALQRGAERRRAQAMGVNPNSGRYMAAQSGLGVAEALAAAGAANIGRRSSLAESEAKSDAMRSNAINLGKGLAVNPATSMSLSNGATSSGFNGAMQGQGQMASLLQSDYQNRLNSFNQQQSGIFGALGTVAGAVPWAQVGTALMGASSKKYKTDKKPAKNNLEKARAMPVGDWKYKDGIADGGRHIGPYAEDFKKATGMGDGKSIDLMTQLGVTLGAVQELDRKVSKLEGKAA